MSATEEVHRALDEFDRVFASGDAVALTELIAAENAHSRPMEELEP